MQHNYYVCPLTCDLWIQPHASVCVQEVKCQLMRQTTAVDSSWQQECVLWAWLCGCGVAPPIQEMRSAIGAVEWPCAMCVHCGDVDAVCLLWDGLRASGGLPGVSWYLSENWCPWGTGCCIVGVVWLLPSGPASGWMYCHNQHFRL